jgi:hypothetical protein
MSGIFSLISVMEQLEGINHVLKSEKQCLTNLHEDFLNLKNKPTVISESDFLLVEQNLNNAINSLKQASRHLTQQNSLRS